MPHQLFFIRAAGALALFAGSACTHLAPPARIAGVAPSPEGVQLAVTGLACDQVQEPEFYGDDLAELTLAVSVRNGTTAAVDVRAGDLRLVVPDGSRLETVSWGAARPLAVERGETKAFEVRFMNRGALACGEEVELDTKGSVTASGRTLDTGPVRFIAAAGR
jgi:hypothetical protein